MKRFLYMLAQFTWGFPQAMAGLAVLAAHARKPHFTYHGALVTIWEPNAGLSLGPFVFIDERHDLEKFAKSLASDDDDDGGIKSGDAGSEVEEEAGTRTDFPALKPVQRVNPQLLVHEYGHTVQSLILGPLYLPVIGLPSIIWMKIPALKRRRRTRSISYYTFYTERWANHLGELVLKTPSMGQALID